MSAAADLIATHILDLRAASSGRLVVGLCGAQGSGKSTAASETVERLASVSVTAAVLALDDFYLPKERRLHLAKEMHPLLAVRGPPGTHDIEAVAGAVQSLRRGEAIKTPTFDKLADDRAPPFFDKVKGPADVVLLEGWCVGAEPAPRVESTDPVNPLEQSRDPDERWRAFTEAALAGAYRSVFAQLDGLVFLRAPSFEVVAGWRAEQERSARFLSGGGRGMSGPEIAVFVQHYERITRRMLASPPAAVTLTIALDAERRVIDAKPSPASRRESR